MYYTTSTRPRRSLQTTAFRTFCANLRQRTPTSSVFKRLRASLSPPLLPRSGSRSATTSLTWQERLCDPTARSSSRCFRSPPLCTSSTPRRRWSWPTSSCTDGGSWCQCCTSPARSPRILSPLARRKSR
eukprot:Mycagemm_TRINITY_DN10339_c3_g5::TRINITY_DN10339_c3_g5_i2::g.970::m.970 type:complete len:129 gc:universal TRINITY_DN10339_c3_g5_i2:725-1111(+)